MGVRGARASSKEADIVILADLLASNRRGPRHSPLVWRDCAAERVGRMVLSVIGMIFAALGYLEPD